jgi:acyl carrier protein
VHLSIENVKDRIVEVMIRELELTINPDDVHGTSRLDDMFAMDSIAITELIIGIEKEFNIKIPAEDLTVEIFQDFETLTEYVKKRLHDETTMYIEGQDKTQC